MKIGQTPESEASVDKRINEALNEAMSTLIYTSGTKEELQGVICNNGTFMFECDAHYQ